MANVKISALPAASTPLTGAALVPIVQSGVTSQTTLAAMPYAPSGTGAVITTVQTKLRETVSVLDFGAYNDGTNATATTAAIQAALTAAERVYFPSGTYLINTVTLKSNNFLYGDGSSTIIKQNTITGASYGTLFADSGSSTTTVDNIVIRDMQIQSPNIVTPVFNEFQHLISLNGVKNVLIENVDFIGFYGDGLYLGSGAAGGQERHNTNVIVKSCFFDGINKENRNGISVIDGEGILIEGNYFTRCTKSTMPGAIDVEPDSSVYHVVRDIKIVNNKLFDIGGNVAAISIYFPGVAYTTAPKGFLIQGNFINTCTSNAFFFSYNVTGGITESTSNFAVKITKNTVVSVNRAFQIPNGKDFQIEGNTFSYCNNAALISYNSGNENALDGYIKNNLFDNCGYVGGNGLEIFKCSRLSIEGNTFKDCGTGVAGAANAIDFNNGTSSYVSIINNIFVSPDSKTLIATQVEASHTLTPSTNTWMNNVIGSLSNYFTSQYNDTAETTYTPVVTGSSTSGTGTYTVQYGRWRRIGKLVFFRVKVSVNSGHTGTGMIQIGLPTIAVSASNNEETTVALAATGVATTGGHIGLINPALVISGSGAIRCYYTATGTLSQMNIPAGAFTINVSGFYQSA